LHDFGGPFGMLWGLQHPERWASVVLLNIGILPGYQWHTMAKRWRTPVLGELVQAWIPRSAWHRAMQQGNPKGLPQEFVQKMYDDYDRGTRRAVLKLYRATPDPGEMADAVGQAMAPLQKPALVIWGAKDQYLSVEYAERQREFFAVERVVVLPDSGHWAFQDDPDAVQTEVMSFLRTQLGRPAGSVPVSERAPDPTP
jgi:pimeloyl-ACP methyl ester carboxylesterase